MKWKTKIREKRELIIVSNKRNTYKFHIGIKGFNKYTETTGKDFQYVIDRIGDETITLDERLEVLYSFCKTQLSYEDFCKNLPMNEIIELFRIIIQYEVDRYITFTSSLNLDNKYLLKKERNNKFKESGLI